MPVISMQGVARSKLRQPPNSSSSRLPRMPMIGVRVCVSLLMNSERQVEDIGSASPSDMCYVCTELARASRISMLPWICVPDPGATHIYNQHGEGSMSVTRTALTNFTPIA